MAVEAARRRPFSTSRVGVQQSTAISLITRIPPCPLKTSRHVVDDILLARELPPDAPPDPGRLRPLEVLEPAAGSRLRRQLELDHLLVNDDRRWAELQIQQEEEEGGQGNLSSCSSSCSGPAESTGSSSRVAREAQARAQASGGAGCFGRCAFLGGRGRQEGQEEVEQAEGSRGGRQEQAPGRGARRARGRTAWHERR